MTTVCITKIYAIKRSSKGSSEFLEFFADANRAFARCDELNAPYEDTPKGQFRYRYTVWTFTLTDGIFYNQD